MPVNNTKTFAVDADIVAYRCAAVCEDSTVEDLCKTIDGFLDNLVARTRVTSLAMFLSDKTNFRYQAAKTKPYKGNRKDIVRPSHLGAAKEYILDIHNGYIHPNYEADDAIASFMSQYDNVAHAGIDKDIRQVPGWHYNFVKHIWEYTSPEESILKIYRQVCQGDTSDNIPGLPGIGKAKAAKAITNPATAEQDAKQFYRHRMHGDLARLKHFKGDKVAQYFDEQYTLVTLVTNLVIPKDVAEEYCVYSPFQAVEGDFNGA